MDIRRVRWNKEMLPVHFPVGPTGKHCLNNMTRNVKYFYLSVHNGKVCANTNVFFLLAVKYRCLSYLFSLNIFKLWMGSFCSRSLFFSEEKLTNTSFIMLNNKYGYNIHFAYRIRNYIPVFFFGTINQLICSNFNMLMNL